MTRPYVSSLDAAITTCLYEKDVHISSVKRPVFAGYLLHIPSALQRCCHSHKGVMVWAGAVTPPHPANSVVVCN